MHEVSRRSFVAASALAGAAFAMPARAAAPFAGVQGPGVYRFKLGEFQISALFDGVWYLPFDDKLVRNASGAEVNQALAAAFLPPNILPISFTVLMVNTGKKVILIDTGTAGQITDTAGSLLDNLYVADTDPKAIDTILISHFHPDHIDGIKTMDGAKVFPNAEILVPEQEWAFWMNDANMGPVQGAVKRYFLNARRIFKDIAGEVRRFAPGAEVAPGIVSVPAFGHTPGHTAFAIHSGDQSMLAMSDTVRNPYLFARYPAWQPTFDMDGPQAVVARRQMLDRVVADRMLVQAYHFPFPACGHMAKTTTGYELVPVEWQPL